MIMDKKKYYHPHVFVIHLLNFGVGINIFRKD